MTDAAKNVEIEDVLASIRRLVSDEVQSGLPEFAIPKVSTSQESAAESLPDALVLTPSLRVLETAETEAACDVTLDLDADQANSDEPADDQNSSSALLQAVAQQVAQLTEADAREEAQVDTGSGEPEQAVEPEAQEPLALAPEHRADSPDNSGALEAKIARLETMINSQDESWEAEGADAPQAMEWEDTDEDDLLDVVSEPEIAEVSIAPSEAVGESEGVTPADAAVEDEIDLLAGPEDAVIDEDMLRDLVATIVREELQGALGERITRNVRKLVRREIHRALASHELE